MPDVCGRLLALALPRWPDALCRRRLPFNRAQPHFAGCLQPFARSASRSTNVTISRLPRTSPGRPELDSDSDHWLLDRCSELNFKGPPLWRLSCRTSRDVRGRLLSLFALGRMSAAVSRVRPQLPGISGSPGFLRGVLGSPPLCSGSHTASVSLLHYHYISISPS